jgi:hypothetical protein
MRTVHETEALRPSDPIPRSHSQAHVKPQRLKLIVNAKPPEREGVNGDGTEVEDSATVASNTDLENDPASLPAYEYPPDCGFTEEEIAIGPRQLYELLKQQARWTEQLYFELKDEADALEAKRKEEWQAKELVLANLVEAELATAVDAKQNFEKIVKLTEELLPKPMLPMGGTELPWYRIPAE